MSAPKMPEAVVCTHENGMELCDQCFDGLHVWAKAWFEDAIVKSADAVEKITGKRPNRLRTSTGEYRLGKRGKVGRRIDADTR